MPLDPKALPRDIDTLQKIGVDLAGQLDRESAEKNKYRDLIRELLEAQRTRKSEQLSREQAELFAAAWREHSAAEESAEDDSDDDSGGPAAGAGGAGDRGTTKKRGRHPLAKHLKHERIVHDLKEEEKHCACCGKELRLIAEESSERYEYIPASLKIIEDVCWPLAQPHGQPCPG
jgi:transposase